MEDSYQDWPVTTKRFVAFLDIMGFKDLVARSSHKEVLGILRSLSNAQGSIKQAVIDVLSEETSTEAQITAAKNGIYTASFSDSIIFFTKDDSPESLRLISMFTTVVFIHSLVNLVPLKGAMAHGSISIDRENNIYFGQPIIDAFLLQEDVNYYGVVAHHSIDECLFDKKYKSNLSLFTECKTPLKSGKLIHNNLRWFGYIDNLYKGKGRQKFEESIKKIKATTSGAPRKYVDNTVDIFSEYNTKSENISISSQ